MMSAEATRRTITAILLIGITGAGLRTILKVGLGIAIMIAFPHDWSNWAAGDPD